jgi:hypothetical protein
MRAGQLTPQAAWDKALLNEETLLFLIEHPDLLDQGQAHWELGPEADAMAKLLLRVKPDVADDPSHLSTDAQIFLAQYWNTKSDARAATILEKLLASLPRRGLHEAIIDKVIYNLYLYYSDSGQPQKAAATAMKALEFESTSPPFKANLLLSAARAFWQAGDKTRADEVYAQVIGYGYGWASGHALSDQATHLFAAGKLEEGRALLKQPIKGINAEQIRVALDQQLARSFFESGEWEQAKYFANATITQYQSLKKPIKNQGLEEQVAAAQSTLAEVERWQEHPVVADLPQIEVQQRGNETTHTHFSIRSYRAITPVVSCDSPDVSLQVLQSPYGENSDPRGVRVYVRIAPQPHLATFNSTIEIRIREMQEVLLRVPVHVRSATEGGQSAQ